MRRKEYGARIVLPVDDGDRFVLVEADGHATGLLQFPGGKNDYGEPLRSTATRELAEEVGVSLSAHEVIELCPWVIEQMPANGNPRHRLWFVFRCERVSLARYYEERSCGQLSTRLMTLEDILSDEFPVDTVTRVVSTRLQCEKHRTSTTPNGARLTPSHLSHIHLLELQDIYSAGLQSQVGG